MPRPSIPPTREKRAKALVTGATGFIGSHLVERLLAEGYQVRALARSAARARRSLPARVRLALGDVRDIESLRTAAEGIDLVFHAAATVTTLGLWRRFDQTTVRGTENVLRASAEAGVRRFVLFSSPAVYDDSALASGFVREDAPLTSGRWTAAFGFYGRSKMLAERAAFRYHSEGRLSVTSLRPTWVYGPRDESIFPYVRLYLKMPFALWIGDHDPLMPFVYVTDVAEAALLAAQTEAAAGQAYNVSGPGYRLRDFLSALAEGIGGRVPSLAVPHRLATAAAAALQVGMLPLSPWLTPPVTPAALSLLKRDVRFDVSKAERELGWRPRVAMEEGIRSTIAWYRGEDVGRRRRGVGPEEGS